MTWISGGEGAVFEILFSWSWSVCVCVCFCCLFCFVYPPKVGGTRRGRPKRIKQSHCLWLVAGNRQNATDASLQHSWIPVARVSKRPHSEFNIEIYTRLHIFAPFSCGFLPVLPNMARRKRVFVKHGFTLNFRDLLDWVRSLNRPFAVKCLPVFQEAD